MTSTVQGKLPIWFWIIAGLAVAWNAMGVYSYISSVTMSAEALAALPEVQRQIQAATPAWVTGAFAIAVFAGLGGSLLLALRKTLATPLFIASLVAVIVQFGYLLGATNAIAAMGAGVAIMPVVIGLIAAFLVWFSMRAKASGWTG